MSVSHSCCSSPWDEISFRLPKGRRKGCACWWDEEQDTRGAVSSVSLWCSLSTPCWSPPTLFACPSSCQQLPVVAVVHHPLALMAKLLTVTVRLAGPKMGMRTLLMLTLTETLAKKPSAFAWACVLSPLAIKQSSPWSSWKCQSRWAPGSDLFPLVLCSQVEAEQPVSVVLGWGDVNNPVSLATVGSLITETQGYLCSWCSGLCSVSGCGSTLLFLEKWQINVRRSFCLWDN